MRVHDADVAIRDRAAAAVVNIKDDGGIRGVRIRLAPRVADSRPLIDDHRNMTQLTRQQRQSNRLKVLRCRMKLLLSKAPDDSTKKTSPR